jgi:hypothetical protein
MPSIIKLIIFALGQFWIIRGTKYFTQFIYLFYLQGQEKQIKINRER